MQLTKVALAALLLSGALSACKQPEPVEPVAADPAPAAAETVAPAPEPMPADPAATMPADPAATMPADAAHGEAHHDEDAPHSGGDKVGTSPAPAPTN